MPNVTPCPRCSSPVPYVSSEIGTAKTCPSCGKELTVPVPTNVQAQQDSRDESAEAARRAWDQRWGKHDHIEDPQPQEDFNGFFRAVRAYSADRGLMMADLLGRAGIFGLPPTEDYCETLKIIGLLPPDEVRQLPSKVQQALRQVEAALKRMFQS